MRQIVLSFTITTAKICSVCQNEQGSMDRFSGLVQKMSWYVLHTV